MTKQEYVDYQARIERELEGLEHISTGACPGCSECGLTDDDQDDEHKRELAEEPSFSWSPCECCGSPLGGNRHPAHGMMKLNDREILIHFSVCEDCLYYLNYGQLDDMTMMEIEKGLL